MLCGGVAQLGEHLPCKQGVMSSNLTISTRSKDRILVASTNLPVFGQEISYLEN